MKKDNGFENIKDIFEKKTESKKAPTYRWQELALNIIKELNIPNNKRSSVFKICKENPRAFVEQSLNDTKELCESGDRWRYFFKLVNQKKDPKN